MHANNIKDQIRRFIAENYLLGREEDLQDDASFLDQGILDSTGVLHLINFIEETYGISVGDEDVSVDNFDTLENVSAYVGRKLIGVAAAHAQPPAVELGGAGA